MNYEKSYRCTITQLEDLMEKVKKEGIPFTVFMAALDHFVFICHAELYKQGQERDYELEGEGL